MQQKQLEQAFQLYNYVFKDNLPTEEDSAAAPDDSDPEAPGRSRILYDNSAESDLAEAEEGEEVREEVRHAWEELVIIQREQQR